MFASVSCVANVSYAAYMSCVASVSGVASVLVLRVCPVFASVSLSVCLKPPVSYVAWYFASFWSMSTEHANLGLYIRRDFLSCEWKGGRGGGGGGLFTGK